MENNQDRRTKTQQVQKRNQKKWLKLGIAVIIVIILGILFVPGIQKKIQSETVQTIVTSQLHSTKVKPIDFTNRDEWIDKQAAVTVVFAEPRGKAYAKLVTLFNDPKKLTQLNRKIYFYPEIYNAKATEKKYKLKTGMVEILFFQEGLEKNRFELQNTQGIEDNFISRINSLAIAPSTPVDEETGQPNKKTSSSTSSSKNPPASTSATKKK
jgi:hypothetical protein